MPRSVNQPAAVSQAAIFGRVCEGTKGMSLALAREIVKLDFTPEDRARVHALSVKNSSGTITADESAEFENFVEVADLLASLQSLARMALSKQLRLLNS